MFQRREQEFGSWLWVWMIFAAVLLALALAFKVPLAQLEGAERFWPLAVLALLLFSLSRIYVVCRKLEIIRIRDRAFSDRVRCVLWERDPERDRFLQVSRYAIDLLGYPVEDWFKDGFWLDHVSDEDRERLADLCSGLPGQASDYECEYRMRHADDHQVVVRDTITVLRNSEGRITRLMGMMVDVTEKLALEQALQQSETRFRSVMEQIPNVAVQGYDRNRKVIFWNGASERIYGFSKAEALGQQLEDLIIPETMRSQLIAQIRRWLDQGEAIPCGEVELVGKGGKPVPVFSSHVLALNSGQEPEMYCLDVEMSEIRRAEAGWRESERRFSMMFEQAAVGMVLRLLDGRFGLVNPRFCEISGYSEHELLSLDMKALSHPDDLRYDRKMIEACLEGSRDSYAHEKRLLRKDGSIAWVRITSSMLRDLSGRPSQFIVFVEDLSAHKESEERVVWLTHYDPLSKLPNRVLLRERLERATVMCQRSGQKLALLALDMDRFKTINDSLGHSIGDCLLVQVADRLRRAVRETDTVSRSGGDEFMIVLCGVAGLDDIAPVVRKILGCFAQPFEIEDQKLICTISVGVTVCPDDGQDCDELIKNADAAMYCAKEDGRSTFRFFTESMNQAAIDRLRLENALRLAIGRSELSLHYQPQVDLSLGTMIGVEALLRWHSADLGEIPPSRFIPVAEECGLIVEIGEWVLHRACEQVRGWREAGLGDVRVAVNLSALQFQRSDIVATVRRALLLTGIPAGLLELELTESILMQDAEGVLKTLLELKAQGVRLSIDDFGTGFSSLAYLKRFPVDKLKIDRSFVKDAASNNDDAEIVRTIIHLGKRFQLEVIAEGTETRSQVEFLIAEGCDSAQGFFFSRPLSEVQINSLIRTGLNSAWNPAGAGGISLNAAMRDCGSMFA